MEKYLLVPPLGKTPVTPAISGNPFRERLQSRLQEQSLKTGQYAATVGIKCQPNPLEEFECERQWLMRNPDPNHQPF